MTDPAPDNTTAQGVASGLQIGSHRMPIRAALVAILLLLAACSGDVRDQTEVPTLNSMAQLISSNPAFGKLDDLILRGDRLWVVDAGGDPFLHTIDAGTGQVILSFGRRGEGPGDFESIMWLQPSRHDPKGVVAFDVRLRRLTEIGVDSSGSPAVGRIIQLPNSPRPRRVVRFGDGYLGWLSEPGPRWVLFDDEGLEATYVDGPLVGPEAAPFKERMNASSALTICAKPDGSRFAVLYVSAGRIELHDSMAAFVGLAEVPDSTNGSFEQQRNGDLRWNGSRYFYSACAATDRYFFALFSGQEEGPAAEVTWAGDMVEVYRWDGVLVGQISLSTRVVRIAIDQLGSTLYGPGADGQTVYRFEIPSEFGGS